MEKESIKSKEAALDALKMLITKWLSENPSTRNYSVLARSSNVSEACIRRIMNNNSFPLAENVFKIVSFIEGGSISNVLSKVDESISKKLKFEMSFLNFNEMNDYKPIPQFESELSNFSAQVIFERSSMEQGISRSEIKDMYGNHGILTSEKLCESGLCTFDGDLLKCSESLKNHTWSTSLYKSFLSQSIKEFYKAESQTNFLFVVNDGVSFRGYSKIMDKLEQCYKDIQGIVNEEKGKIPVTLGGFMDTLTYNDIFKKSEENT